MDDKASVLSGELSRLRRCFEALEALASNCILTTERSTILSRYQVRRPVPLHIPRPLRDLPAGYTKMAIPGNGCEVLQERILSFDELDTACVFYSPAGEPCINFNGEPMFKTAGWETIHLIQIRGRDCDAVAKEIEAANHLRCINHKCIQSIGLLPQLR